MLQAGWLLLGPTLGPPHQQSLMDLLGIFGL